MISVSNKERCVGCTACASTCPKQCISMILDEEGFQYPSVNKDRCINCGICEKVCLFNRHPLLDKEFSDYSLGVVNKDDYIREKSSSGGLFSLLAEYVLNHGGIVFGVCVNEKMEVRHIAIENIHDLEYLRGSKYVQSNLTLIYPKVKNQLRSGRLVMFSGTACQISGLLSYLGEKKENLVCIDIACHGVASPAMFKQYIKTQENKAKAKAVNINFRDKISGWKSYSVRIKFDGKEDYLKPAYNDWYMKAYLSKLYLRPSCYACPVKGTKREADITLADFWGIERILPEKDDNKGCSFAIVHSEKGKKLMEKIKVQAMTFDVDLTSAVQYNKAIVESSEKPVNRERFIEEMNKYGFLKTAKKFCRDPLILRIKIFISKILSRILQ